MESKTEYLYGDSTPAPIAFDLIAFLRDVFDFAVDLLLKDAQAVEATQCAARFSDATEAAIGRAEALAAQVVGMLEHADAGNQESLVGRCAAKIRYGTSEVVRAEAEAARAAVTAEKGRAVQAAAAARGACEKALEVLLLRQEIPGTAVTVTLTLAGAPPQYHARLRGQTSYGLAWDVALDIPPSHALSRVLRIDRVAEKLEVDAPEEAGWLHKEVKIRPQRLDRYYLAEMTLAAEETTLKLRAAVDGTGPGFDLTLPSHAGAARLSRILESGAAPDNRYDVSVEDTLKLSLLREALAALVDDIRPHRTEPVLATLDGAPLRKHEMPREVVDRIIASIAPEVREIAKRSQSPGEMVLRRRLGDNLREEVFVTIAELEKKLEPLPPALREAFEPLHLWNATKTTANAKTKPPPPRQSTPIPPATDTASNGIKAPARPAATVAPVFLHDEPTVIVAEFEGT